MGWWVVGWLGVRTLLKGLLSSVQKLSNTYAKPNYQFMIGLGPGLLKLSEAIIIWFIFIKLNMPSWQASTLVQHLTLSIPNF
jgi:hypothetical protein